MVAGERHRIYVLVHTVVDPVAFLAVCRLPGADDLPSDFATVTALQGFWDALRFDSGADNVALRVLRFEA